MGIGRAAFVSRFRDELGILASAGLVEGSVGDIYINRAHGVAFTRPPGWEFEGVEQTAKSQAGNLYEFEDLDETAFAEYIRGRPLHAPYVTIADKRNARKLPGARSPEIEDMATLAFIAFEGTWREDWSDPQAPFSLRQWIERDLSYFQAGYHSFELTQEPSPTVVSECEAAFYVAEYMFGHADLPYRIPIREIALYVHQEPAIQGVRMFDFPAADPPLTFDYSDFTSFLCFM